MVGCGVEQGWWDVGGARMVGCGVERRLSSPGKSTERFARAPWRCLQRHAYQLDACACALVQVGKQRPEAREPMQQQHRREGETAQSLLGGLDGEGILPPLDNRRGVKDFDDLRTMVGRRACVS